MNRRTFSALAGVLGLCGCAVRPIPRPTLAFSSPLSDRPGEKPRVLILAPVGSRSDELVEAVKVEILADFHVEVYAMERGVEAADLAPVFRGARPEAVVLVDNSTVRPYAAWARGQSDVPAAVIVMASFAEELKPLVPNSTGIAFEPPAVTSLAEARRVLGVPVQKVGVVIRAGFEPFLDREQKRAAKEQLLLVPRIVSHNPSYREVHLALRSLYQDGIHALWVPNDNVLLTGMMIRKSWVPVLERRELPVIVGAPSLVRSRPHFGTFAAVPDVEALGVQTADLLFMLASQGFQADPHPIQPALSLKTYVDTVEARRLGMTRKAELTVDFLVGE